MGWTFLDVDTLPEPDDIVWCKWPYRENPGLPGPHARPVLVREVLIHEQSETGLVFGSIVVSYGTGEFTSAHRGVDLIVEGADNVRRCGLHKATRFSLDPGGKKHLIWAEEYFLPPDYVRGQGVGIGRLGEQEVEQMRRCLVRRGLIEP